MAFPSSMCCFFFQAEDGIRDIGVTGVQTCALPICVRLILPILIISALTLASPIAITVIDPEREYEFLSQAVGGRYRSEERRVGKECRSRCAPYHYKKRETKMNVEASYNT